VANLDDAPALRAADPGGLLEAALGLSAQCREGLTAGRAATGLPSGASLSSIAVCGMGGSGVSGDVIRALFRDRLPIPVDVVRSPVLPEYVGKDALVLCSSYSGDTAETLDCFEEAARRGCRLLAVTTGGRLAARVRDMDAGLVLLSSRFPAPRAAVGALAMGALGALEGMGVVPVLDADLEDAAGTLEGLSEELAPERRLSGNEAKALAARIGDRFPVVWGAEGIGSAVAARWKTGFNENAKVPAFWSSLPELDHNEVVGWSPGMGERFFLVTLRTEGEHPDVAARFEVSVDIARSSGMDHEEVRAAGRSDLARLMSLVMKGDVTSVYLAVLRGEDPGPIHAIDRVKRELAGQ
jgi:glucose/mannose-6-phosphate isomerase